MDKPLSGLKIIELSTYVAAPISAKMLGEWGADVIKVEPHFGDEYRVIGRTLGMPTSDDQNPCFDLENTNKKFISLNLKSEKGYELLLELIKDADGLITNYRPEALTKLKLNYEDLKEINPRLVYGHVIGYGLQGPDKDKAGFDLTAFFARSGLMLDPVERGTSPMNTLVAVGDHATGVSLAAGMCAGLVKQARTGKGEKVVSGLYQNSLYLCSSMIAGSKYGVNYPIKRTEALSPLVNSYQCKDGEWILLAGTSYDFYWDKVARQVFKDEELANNEKYQGVMNMVKHNKEMIALFDEKFKTKNRDEWEALLNAADVANEKILHWTDVLEDEQAKVNGYIYEAEYANGQKSTLVSTPVDFDSVEKVNFKPTSGVGSHTDEVLEGLGYTKEQIQALRESKEIK